MPHPAPQIARGHLRLAPPPDGRRRPAGRAGLLVRALAAHLALRWLTATAWLATIVALLPLLWRGAPLGRRLHPPAPKEARIIPFQARRRALPR